MQSNSLKSVRVFSAVGPGDVVSAFRDWKRGVRTISETSLTFSGQELSALSRLGIEFWLVSSHSRAEYVTDGKNRIENRPRANKGQVHGLAYHWYQLRYASSLLISAVRFRASHAVVDAGTMHWAALVIFRSFGIEVIPNLHNVSWPVGHPPESFVKQFFLQLDRLCFRACVKKALGVSMECGRQVAWLSGGRCAFYEYRAQFAAEDFSTIPPPRLDEPVLHVMFAGRVEHNKGVFDFLGMCERLSSSFSKEYVFEVCGAGPAFEKLREAAASSPADKRFVLHGKLERPQLLAVYARSHVVVVPTRSDFCEGLPMVCAEAVLAGRPVLTSRLSNALEALAGAVVEAKENDVDDYVKQLSMLVQDVDRYNALVAATRTVSGQFIDRSRGLDSVLERCLMG